MPPKKKKGGKSPKRKRKGKKGPEDWGVKYAEHKFVMLEVELTNCSLNITRPTPRAASIRWERWHLIPSHLG